MIPQMPHPGVPPAIPSRYSAAGPSIPLRQCTDWSLPIPSKNKYRQQFYDNDKQNTGMMSGNQGKYVLMQTGLPTQILADIWALSDVNKDGWLTAEEFCVAMHFVDMYKAGYALPRSMPQELMELFPNYRQFNSTPTTEPKKTFEDKFMDSYNRGQAELERRREVARKEEERLRAETERREREDYERRERERQEMERIREAEREAERQKALERERQRQEEEARIRAEREAIRKKLEDERLKELENIRIRELEGKKATEAERTAQIQQRQKNMSFQLQALQEKSDSINVDVTAARDEIIAITAEIEGMRGQRDEKLAAMNALQRSHQQLSIQCERVSHEHLQLQSEFRQAYNRTETIEQNRKQINERKQELSKLDAEVKALEERNNAQTQLLDAKKPESDKSNEKFSKLISEYNELVRRAASIQQDLRRKAAEKAQAAFAERNASFNNSFGFGNSTTFDSTTPAAGAATSQSSHGASFDDSFVPPAATTNNHANLFESTTSPSASTNAFAKFEEHNASANMNTAAAAVAAATGQPQKYRALYEFVARSDDELSLQPGDVILVFDSQNNAEPGWLAGQIKGKAGWFPAAFAELIASGKKSSLPNVVTSPSSEPLASITEEPGEKDVTEAVVGPAGNYDLPPVVDAYAPSASLYDKPPGDEVPSEVVEVPSVPTYDAPPGDTPLGSPSDKVIAHGTALYKWNGPKEDDLSFAKGDEIEVLEQSEMKWRGRLAKDRGKSGWFPKSYIKVSTGNATSAAPPSAKTNGHSTDASTTTIPSGGGGEWYVALWSFEAVEPTDLSFKPGDRIWVTEHNDQWWKGTLNGQTGIFPATYVQKATTTTPTTAAAAPATDFKAPAVVSAETVKDAVARALANFDATADNQISLKVGDLVKIRSTSPAGWWEGEIQLSNGESKTGWFPGNYVELVNSADSPQRANIA